MMAIHLLTSVLSVKLSGSAWQKVFVTASGFIIIIMCVQQSQIENMILSSKLNFKYIGMVSALCAVNVYFLFQVP